MKDFRIIYKDKDKAGRAITARQAQAVTEALKNKEVMYIELKDENGKLEEIVDKKNIKEVVRNTEEDMSSAKWYCDNCDTWNPMHVWPSSKCQCKGDRTEWLQRLQAKLT